MNGITYITHKEGKAGNEITDDGYIDLQMKKRKSNEGG